MLTACSAKRMYYPQTYHHIQEIQKYNIQDYRPRYESLSPPLLLILLISSKDGTIPKSHPKSPPSAKNAQATRICLLPSRRISNPRITSIRYDTGTRKIRRNGKFAARRTLNACMMLGYCQFWRVSVCKI